jgi:hypothetical protein
LQAKQYRPECPAKHMQLHSCNSPFYFLSLILLQTLLFCLPSHVFIQIAQTAILSHVLAHVYSFALVAFLPVFLYMTTPSHVVLLAQTAIPSYVLAHVFPLHLLLFYQ